MNISKFFNDFKSGNIQRDSEVPMNAGELYDLLEEYILSIKMHQSTTKENNEMKITINSLREDKILLKSKLEYAHQMEKLQRNRADIAEKRVREDSVVHYKKGEIFDVIR
jgi:hypothetical protein